MNTLRKIPVKENSAKRKKEIKKEIMESLSILFMKSLVVELSPVVVLFYLVPLIVVPAIVITLSNAIKTGRLKNPYAGGIVLSAAFSGVTAFGLGMIVVSAKGNYTPGVIAGLSIVGLLFAISLLFAVGLFTGMYPPSVRKEPVPVSKNTYVAYSSVLGIVSIVILFEMLSMPFGNVYDQSLYGIGLGFLFIIGGVMIRLYRGQFYNE